MGETEKNRLTLRAHHLLCLHGFHGLGYDEQFVENMAKILQRVRSNPKLQIVVTDEPDDICAACPHADMNTCPRCGPEAEVSSKLLDERVLKQLGIGTGQVFSRDEIIALVEEKIASDDLVVLCQGCEWLPFEYCAEGLRGKRLSSDEAVE